MSNEPEDRIMSTQAEADTLAALIKDALRTTSDFARAGDDNAAYRRDPSEWHANYLKAQEAQREASLAMWRQFYRIFPS